jgi:hypothetical protein
MTIQDLLPYLFCAVADDAGQRTDRLVEAGRGEGGPRLRVAHRARVKGRVFREFIIATQVILWFVVNQGFKDSHKLPSVVNFKQIKKQNKNVSASYVQKKFYLLLSRTIFIFYFSPSSPCARDRRSRWTKLNALRHVGKPVWVALAAAILESGATAACRVVVEHG